MRWHEFFTNNRKETEGNAVYRAVCPSCDAVFSSSRIHTAMLDYVRHDCAEKPQEVKAEPADTQEYATVSSPAAPYISDLQKRVNGLRVKTAALEDSRAEMTQTIDKLRGGNEALKQSLLSSYDRCRDLVKSNDAKEKTINELRAGLYALLNAWRKDA